MDLKDKVIVVTGGGQGIGAALARRFVCAEARVVVVADIDFSATEQVAKEIGAVAMEVDVSSEQQIKNLVEQTESKFGGVDLFCSNAGIMVEGSFQVPDREWERIWQIHVMSHVYAARAVIPQMIRRGSGYLLQTVSAAGLLTQVGSAPYSVTKHAALAFAEWLSITYQRQGLRVSCLCPQGVRTRMLEEACGGAAEMLKESSLSADEVAEAVVQGIESEQFLILPHPEVATYFQNKALDYERWLRGMRRMWEKMVPQDSSWEMPG